MLLNREKVVVFMLVLLAAVLRLWRIDKDLLIHYDQGRDLLAAYDIWKLHHPTLLGPTADDETKGIFFSPIYYYLISLPLWLTAGNPVSAIVFLIAIELASMLFLYIGAKKLFGKQTALLTLAMVVVSFGQVSFSRWLSNAMPVQAIGNVFIFLLAKIANKEKVWHRFWLSLGILFVFNPAAGIGMVIFALVWQIAVSKESFMEIIKGILLFLLPAIPQLLFEVRHQFLITHGIWRMITNRSEGLGWSFLSLFAVGKVFGNFLTGIWSHGVEAISLAGLIIVFFNWTKPKYRNQQILFFWVFSQVAILFLFRRPMYPHFYAAIGSGLILLLVNSLVNIGKQVGIIICLVLVSANIFLDYTHLTQPNLGLTPIGTANLVTLENRLKALDFIQHTSGKNSYSLWTYTIPYFQDQPWRYLLLWKDMKRPVEKGEIFYTLYERDWDRPDRLEDWLASANKISQIEQREKIANFTVEKRTWK